MSKLEEEVSILLQSALPNYKIERQHSVSYMGHRLFFDFYVPAICLLVECQGEQHYKYVSHFHGMKSGYQSSRKRDQLKREWAEKNELYLLEIKYDACPNSPKQLLNIIYEVVFNE